MIPERYSPLTLEDLNANRFMVSVNEYGLFLCRKGTARVLMGSQVYRIYRNCLCIYPPNTFLQILDKSEDLDGLLEIGNVDSYYPTVSAIDIRSRLRIRNRPCVEITEHQAEEITRLARELTEAKSKTTFPNADKLLPVIRMEFLRHLRNAVCMKVLEAYFSNTPVDALPQSKENAVLNHFLLSVYENCHRWRTVQYYADEQHLSPYYFSTIIRRQSGKSALHWIEDVTMLFVRRYLGCSDMSIKEVAERMNFPDQSTLGRYVKHHEGCSPSEFRKRMK